ncbi:MAG: hypothetical protein ACRDTN_03950, partial [Mycobacterium sp.]
LVFALYSPQSIHVAEAQVEFPPPDRDEKGRMKMPAYLLSAHKAG